MPYEWSFGGNGLGPFWGLIRFNILRSPISDRTCQLFNDGSISDEVHFLNGWVCLCVYVCIHVFVLLCHSLCVHICMCLFAVV